eukprot:4816089-Amphidinium_carterae.1
MVALLLGLLSLEQAALEADWSAENMPGGAPFRKIESLGRGSGAAQDPGQVAPLPTSFPPSQAF